MFSDNIIVRIVRFGNAKNMVETPVPYFSPDSYKARNWRFSEIFRKVLALIYNVLLSGNGNVKRFCLYTLNFVFRNRLFGYTTVNNYSEGVILSWIAGADTTARTRAGGGWQFPGPEM